MEQMLRVQMVKFAGPGFNSMPQERRKRREEAGRLEYAGERTAERLQSGCVGVLLTSHEVQGRISGKIIIIIIIFICPIIQQYTHLHGYGLEEQDSKVR